MGKPLPFPRQGNAILGCQLPNLGLSRIQVTGDRLYSWTQKLRDDDGGEERSSRVRIQIEARLKPVLPKGNPSVVHNQTMKLAIPIKSPNEDSVSNNTSMRPLCAFHQIGGEY